MRAMEREPKVKVELFENMAKLGLLKSIFFISYIRLLTFSKLVNEYGLSVIGGVGVL